VQADWAAGATTLVSNTTGLQIRVSDGRSSVVLDPLEDTTEFNGKLEGTVWSGALTGLGALGLPLPRCLPVGFSFPYPDVRVEVTLECEPEG